MTAIYTTEGTLAERREKAGLCLDCGVDNKGGKNLRCDVCSLVRNRDSQRYRARQKRAAKYNKKRADRILKGQCYKCGALKEAEKLTLCFKCHLEAQAKKAPPKKPETGGSVAEPALVAESSVPLASPKKRSRRPHLNFFHMGIKEGETLVHRMTRDKVEIRDPKRKKVSFEGKVVSIQQASDVISKRLGYVGSASANKEWLFQGRLLQDILEETYKKMGYGSLKGN